MEPIFAIKSHRRKVSESIQRIMEKTKQDPVQILLSRCAIYEYFIDDEELKDRFNHWVQKKKLSEKGETFNG
ncbi:hypothetical protein JWG45_14525 [Leptospira sp. 201903070]|uniref:Uncharacterized protein n=2 Tax=Leptospira ainlahdjerensis TaxID=2810033 RepID=A0ABS2UDW6_9LEPT|nr:hypothetical protein [Leptospira ainlahdjerensis]